jgi:iron-sulfur cluster assembly protein
MTGADVQSRGTLMAAELAVTTRALTAIGVLVAAASPAFDPTTAGLRIWPDATTDPPIAVGVAALPAEDDERIEAEGVRIFLAPGAMDLLESKVLDALITDGVAVFALADRLD